MRSSFNERLSQKKEGEGRKRAWRDMHIFKNSRDRKVARQTPAAKPKEQNSILRTYMMEGENRVRTRHH